MDPNTQYYNPPDSLLPLKKKKKIQLQDSGTTKLQRFERNYTL